MIVHLLLVATASATTTAPGGDKTLSQDVEALWSYVVTPGRGTLQAAADKAKDSSVLWLQDGTYTSAADGVPVLTIAKNITVRARHAAVLDGEGINRVVHIKDGSVALDGLSITGGFMPTGPPGTAKGGAGVRIEKIAPPNTVEIDNCNVYNNHAGEVGGGVYIYGVKVTFKGGSFTNNTAKMGNNVFSHVCSLGDIPDDVAYMVDEAYCDKK